MNRRPSAAPRMLILLAVLLAQPVLGQPADAAARIETSTVSTAGAPATGAVTGPQVVTVGIYLLNVNDIDIKTSVYTADFYLWFRWRGDVDPNESFELTNDVDRWGTTRIPLFSEPLTLPSGEFYQCYHVQGKFNRKFELWHYPLDRQEVIVRVETTRDEVGTVVYVADTKDSEYNRTLRLPGWVITGQICRAETVTYGSHFGDTGQLGGSESYSRFEYGIVIERSRKAYMMRLMLPITVILLSTFTSFFLLPEYADSRIGIVITSLLSSVALHLAEGQDLPAVGYLVLMDKVYNLSYLVILLALVETITVIRLKDRGLEEWARRWDRRTMIALPLIYVGGLIVTIVYR